MHLRGIAELPDDSELRASARRIRPDLFLGRLNRLPSEYFRARTSAARTDCDLWRTNARFSEIPEIILDNSVLKRMESYYAELSADLKHVESSMNRLRETTKLAVDRNAQRLERPRGRMNVSVLVIRRHSVVDYVGKCF